jgi:PAS domain S-box-containing protein
MMAGGFIFGVMCAHSTTRRDFSQRDAQFLETVANILTIAALRRQAVVALRQSNRGLQETKQYLSNVIETSSDAIVSTNPEGKVILCNTGTERLLGYQRQEVVGQPVVKLFETEEEAEKIHAMLRKEGGTVAGLETTLVAKDGTRIPVLVSASLFYDEEGQETGSVRFNRDIRDRLRWQRELDQINEEIVETQNTLEQAQAEVDAAGELRKVNEELQKQMEYTKKAQEQLVLSEKMVALGRLTAGVSHEILNPLNVIVIRLHMLVSDPDTPPEIVKKLRSLDEQAHRIAKITEGLLDYARKRAPDRKKINFNETVMGTLDLIVHDFKTGNVTVVLGFDSQLPPVLADFDQLQQVVLNLLTNARDAMPKGGQLKLSTSTIQKNGQGYVELRVEDSGPGIPKESIDKLFDPFFTTKPEGEGTGLGLSICEGIVEAHGGSIRAENMPLSGAAFTLLLPLENGEEE